MKRLALILSCLAALAFAAPAVAGQAALYGWLQYANGVPANAQVEIFQRQHGLGGYSFYQQRTSTYGLWQTLVSTPCEHTCLGPTEYLVYGRVSSGGTCPVYTYSPLYDKAFLQYSNNGGSFNLGTRALKLASPPTIPGVNTLTSLKDLMPNVVC